LSGRCEGCLESWTSLEPVAWPWCNFAASRRRPYCTSVKSLSPVGLISRQWDAVDWACVLCDRRIHKSPFQRRFYLWKKPKVAGSQIWALWALTGLSDVMICPKSLHESCRMGRHIVLIKLICSLGHCECDGHTVDKLSQRLLTADWLVPRESDCSQMDSKVFSDWLPSYIKAKRPVLEIFKRPDTFRTTLVHECVYGEHLRLYRWIM
jgi:hypothetical protein